MKSEGERNEWEPIKGGNLLCQPLEGHNIRPHKEVFHLGLTSSSMESNDCHENHRSHSIETYMTDSD